MQLGEQRVPRSGPDGASATATRPAPEPLRGRRIRPDSRPRTVPTLSPHGSASSSWVSSAAVQRSMRTDAADVARRVRTARHPTPPFLVACGTLTRDRSHEEPPPGGDLSQNLRIDPAGRGPGPVALRRAISQQGQGPGRTGRRRSFPSRS
jgi:hypothetical protein